MGENNNGGHAPWVDETEPIPNEFFYFEDLVSSHGRFVTTAWLPFDEYNYSELYKTIITQLQFIRSTIDSPSLNLKRGKQAGNSIHLSSAIQTDVLGAMDILTELVNFRIRSRDYKLKRKPATAFVDLFTIVNYNGCNIIGSQGKNGKNFIVNLSDIFGIKTMISYPDQKTIRVALLGKPDNTARARAEIELMVTEIANGIDEEEVQARALEHAKESLKIKILKRKVPVVEPVIESDEVPVLCIPENVMSECNITTSDLPEHIEDSSTPTKSNVKIEQAFESHLPSVPPVHFYPPPPAHIIQNHQSQLFTHVFAVTFNQLFMQNFAMAFDAAYRSTFGNQRPEQATM